MSLDYARGGTILGAYVDAFEAFDGDAFTALVADDVEFRPDAFSAPLVGSNAVRAYLLQASRDREQLEITIERHWVVAPTILAAFHSSYVRTLDRARVHLAGFLTAEVGGDGRIERLRQWTEAREAPAE
jgi:ketosteroid isomerase-like protein